VDQVSILRAGILGQNGLAFLSPREFEGPVPPCESPYKHDSLNRCVIRLLPFADLGARAFSGIRGRQVLGEAVGPHLPLLMGEDAKVAASHRAAEKDEASGLVFREVRIGTVVFYGALD
jgi:hypothetical protein